MILCKFFPIISKFCYIGTCILILSACTPADSSSQNNTDNVPPSPDQKFVWELSWTDEFEYEGLPDSTKWSYENGYIRNNELQYYTKRRSKNARVEKGTLIIESRNDNYNGHSYTSASLHTRNKAEWQYAKIEVRAKLPSGRGMWPAIWMLGTNIENVGWPACGEIDIMENVGFDPYIVHANIHTEAYNHTKGTNKGNHMTVDAPYEKFHTYTVEWLPQKISFYIDGNQYFTFNKESSDPDVWPFDQPFYLIINAAIGGAWGGTEGVADSIFPQKYYVDYVRVYKPTWKQEE
ncbi:glycoside hydrolase family 16 protein [Aliifodinibius salicampi]|uniref:Glycoside hydrolase family 16 protein n=1 Tax=Fodinibius salicampi TaxID=1920655 RepID=A0ABT3Q2G5_9BACT|nr:glycoside hydrolase family 16 protein [Fodinibius salicampi]MCW9714299.1 glycoside hydrolase family 16 protein [Fodinibius salicampi]